MTSRARSSDFVHVEKSLDIQDTAAVTAGVGYYTILTVLDETTYSRQYSAWKSKAEGRYMGVFVFFIKSLITRSRDPLNKVILDPLLVW